MSHEWHFAHLERIKGWKAGGDGRTSPLQVPPSDHGAPTPATGYPQPVTTVCLQGNRRKALVIGIPLTTMSLNVLLYYF